MKTKNYILILLLSVFGTQSYAAPFHPDDNTAMMAFVASTNGNAAGGWNTLLPAAQQWSAANPVSQWYGVGVVEFDGKDRVTSIDLSGMSVGGLLPDNWFTGLQLAYLSDLDLSNNQLTGSLNTAWASAPHTSLTTVNISNNLFDYAADFFDNLLGNTEPDELYARNYLNTAVYTNNPLPSFPVVSLSIWDLGENKMTGVLPDFGSAAPDLVEGYFDNNHFTDILQHSSPGSSKIDKLDISHNDMTDLDNVVHTINTHKKIQYLYARSAMDNSVQHNYTASTINITSGGSNKVIDLGENNLYGPFDLSKFDVQVSELYFDHNLLHSLTPHAVDAADMYILDLGHNDFSGPLPACLFVYISKIDSLCINDNNFTGPLPDPNPLGFPEYTWDKIHKIDFSNNNISGELRLDWMFDMDISAGSPDLEKLYLGGNLFEDVVLPTAPLGTFSNLVYVDVDSNYFHFDDLYLIATGLNMKRVWPNGAGEIGHYVPLANTDTLAYDYHPQYNAFEGGTRRRDEGAATVFKAEIGAPTWVGYYNYYNWYRDDLANGGGTEYFGQVNTNGVSTTTSGVPTVTVTPGTYQLSPSNQFDTRQHLYIDPVDATYHDWSYKGCASNDTFSLTSICTNFKKFVVGPCYDSLGRKIRCQEMIIQFAAGTTDEDKDSLRVELDIERIDSCICGSVELWAISDTTNQLEVEQNGTGTRKAVTNVGTRPSLLGVDPNYDLADDIAPVVGDSTPSAPSGNTNSSATLVAIIDSGVDYDHPDVADRIAINTDDLTFDGIDDDANCVVDDAYGYNALDVKAVPFDDHGHGTSIAGILAGRSTPNVSPNSGPTDNLAIVPMKYTGQKGRGSSYNAACAIRHAADYVDPFTGGEIRVINASWGYYGEPSAVLEEAIRYAGEDCGLLFVCSAGNDGFDNDTVSHYPSNYTLENILVVAAVQNGNPDQLEAYSSYGAESVDIAAEGNFTTARAGTGAGTHSMDGTSFATAQVTRAAGLLFQAHPESSYRAVRHAILSSADPLSGPDAAKLSSGGRLDFAAAQSALAGNADRVECMPIVHLDVRLEGPLKSNGVMEADLFTTGNLPNSQPYNVAPWFYNGTESIAATFTGGNRPVDWVLLRFDTERGNHSMYVAGLLQRDGDIVDGFGEGIRFPETYSDRDYYVTVIHRNHLALTSRVPIQFDYPATSFDLSDLSAGAPATSRYKDLYSYRVLVAGDGNSDSQVNPVDKNVHWIPQDGQSGYKSADYNLDGVVDNADRALWELNKSIETDAARGYEDSNN